MSGILSAIQGIVGIVSLIASFFVGLGAAFSLISLLSLLTQPNPFGGLNDEIQNAAVMTAFLILLAVIGVKFAGMMVAEE